MNTVRNCRLPPHLISRFCHFHDPVPDDSYELCVISLMGVVGLFYKFPPNTIHPEGGNYYVDKLLFKSCLRIAVIVILNTLTEQEETRCVWFL